MTMTQAQTVATPWQSPDALVDGTVRAVAYSGFREGQHPDRGEGANNPSDAEILEDLEILVDNGLTLIRLYDSGENSEATLRIIREHKLPIKVMQGIWLRAEVSNHGGCEWVHEPQPQEELDENRRLNEAEVQAGIELAIAFDDIVVAVNVGNESLIYWNDHLVSVEQMIDYVKTVQAAIEQPVTVAENYEWWAHHGHELGQVVDFIGVHTYPAWEHQPIDNAMNYTIDNMQMVRNTLPDRPMAILEAGWASTAIEFGERANETDQQRYFDELMAWGEENNVTVFFFEAFDEPWKGHIDNELAAEKHWGLFFVDRTPKQVMKR